MSLSFLDTDKQQSYHAIMATKRKVKSKRKASPAQKLHRQSFKYAVQECAGVEGKTKRSACLRREIKNYKSTQGR